MAERRRGVHESAIAQPPDFRRELGPVYIPPDEARRPLRIIDPKRAATLRAWIDTLVPGDEHWPGAAETDGLGYIDAVAQAAPALRPIILHGIDTLGALATDEHGTSFALCTEGQRRALLVKLELLNPDGAFELVFELALEAYYRDDCVLGVLEKRTGFSMQRATEGWEMEPFDESALDRVRAMPPRYRVVDSA